MRFINDHIKTKKGGRKAVKISKKDLKNKIDTIIGSEEDIFALLDSSTISKDLNKINFDCENISGYEDSPDTYGDFLGESLVGYHTLENGFTFCGFAAGGDWEEPLFFIIYFDGTCLRGYIPSMGNMINLNYKTAFGSEADAPLSIQHKNEIIYKKLGIWDTSDYKDYLTMYLKRYDLKQSDLGFNFDAIKQSILDRFTII